MSNGVYQFGPFHLDAAERRLLRDGEPIALRPKVFETLCTLVENDGRLVTKEALLRQIWPDTVVEENNLNANISVLRKILGQCAEGESYIETIPRVGYRFAACITNLAAAVPSAANAVAAETPAAKKSVAVLYFENLSGAKEDEYFRDGMTEDVITELAKIRELRLFPRSAVLPFRDKPLPVAQIGQQLHAAYVLEGSIRCAGKRLRITARLAETSTGHSVWAERYDRRLEDVFAIQDEIAQSIARALRVVLTEKERSAIEKIPTIAIQAYDYYLRGRQFFYQMRRNGLEFARQMFARAIVIDPKYARAYAGVADCCSFLYMWCEATENNLEEALSAARRAVELDPQSAEAHASLGLAEFLGRDFENARQEFETALNLDPELFEAYYFYARSCFAQGQHEKAADLFARAGEVDPDDYQAQALGALCLRALGRIDEARAQYRTCMRKIERRLELHPDDVRAIALGSGALYEIGENAQALEWADRALSMYPDEAPLLYNVACTYAVLRETEKALDCLEKAFRMGFGYKEWMENDPDLISVREQPRFKALMERIGQSAHAQIA